MKRLQVYLDDDLWQVLHAKAAREETSVSELLRVAIRECCLGSLEKRREAMTSIVGLWKDRADLDDTESMVRALRRDTRREGWQ